MPEGHGTAGSDEPAVSGGDVRASARGHAQQAVIGRGVQHNYFYGASGSARPRGGAEHPDSTALHPRRRP